MRKMSDEKSNHWNIMSVDTAIIRPDLILNTEDFGNPMKRFLLAPPISIQLPYNKQKSQVQEIQVLDCQSELYGWITFVYAINIEPLSSSYTCVAKLPIGVVYVIENWKVDENLRVKSPNLNTTAQ